MKKLFRFWAGILILAMPKNPDTQVRRFQKVAVARLLTIIIPSTIVLAYQLLISSFPELIHFFAVSLLLMLIPMWIIWMWHLHKLKLYLRRKENASK